MKSPALLVIIVTLAAGAARVFSDSLEDTLYVPLDHPAIQYSKQPGNNAVARLDKRLENGQTKLDYAPNGWGYLPALLKELGIAIDSQVLVFSKTSIQTNRISPRTPRALYFNDEVAVGFVQSGEALEVTALDAERGVYMYTLDTAKSDNPRLGRREDCLRCHQGPITLGVPGLMVSSVHPQTEAREGHGSSFVTDQRVEINGRWGGWYVTGTTGSQHHLGNNINLVDPLHPGGPAGPETQNVTSLADMFDTSKYLAPTSDIVALMTLEHQTRMTNLITRIGWDARIGTHDGWTDSTRKQFDAEVDEMVAYMTFANEAPLQAPVQGVSSFTKTFATRAPRDKQGRSLRDFDLHTRLFRYPLSYMIYTAAFDGLPDLAREQIFRRLYDIFSNTDQSKRFSRISAEDRSAALEIVRETKSNLPAYWRPDRK